MERFFISLTFTQWILNELIADETHIRSYVDKGFNATSIPTSTSAMFTVSSNQSRKLLGLLMMSVHSTNRKIIGKLSVHF